jgi:hypothetical protein
MDAVQPESAVTQFFAIAELLEQVLNDVGADVRELLSLCQVCRQWQNVIKASPSLRRIMFLSAQPLDHEWLGEDRRATDGRYERLLVKQPRGNAGHPSARVLKSACLNPLLFYTKPRKPDLHIWRPHMLHGDPDQDPHIWTSQELYLRRNKRSRGVRKQSLLLDMPSWKLSVPTANRLPACEQHRQEHTGQSESHNERRTA